MGKYAGLIGTVAGLTGLDSLSLISEHDRAILKRNYAIKENLQVDQTPLHNYHLNIKRYLEIERKLSYFAIASMIFLSGSLEIETLYEERIKKEKKIFLDVKVTKTFGF